MKKITENHDGSSTPAVQSQEGKTAGTVSDSEQVKVSLPWICQQGCGKAPATCRKTVPECEHALFMQNESERFAPCYRRRSGRARV